MFLLLEKTEKHFVMQFPESRKYLLVESRTLGFGNGEYSSRNPDPTKDWNLEFKFHCLKIQNPRREIKNLRLSWIPLHVEKQYTDPSGAPIENIVQNHLNIALLYVF